MSVRFRICLAAWIAVVVLSAVSNNVSGQTVEAQATPIEDAPAPPVQEATIPLTPLPAVEEEWVIDIRPSLKVQRHVPTTYDAPVQDGEEPCQKCGTASVNDYVRVYNSIPFNRAEYNANPTYRHDSTMELLTGNARHQTIIGKNNTRQAPVRRAFYGRTAGVGLNPYQYGYLRPALRLQYYRHFPSLNPYVNFWNYSGAF